MPVRRSVPPFQILTPSPSHVALQLRASLQIPAATAFLAFTKIRGGIGHVGIYQSFLLKSLRNPTRHDSEESMILSPAWSSDEKVAIINLNRNLFYFHKELLRVTPDDLRNQSVTDGGSQCPVPESFAIYFKNQMQRLLRG